MPFLAQLQPPHWAQASLVSLSAYALGCLCTGYYIVRKQTGLDLRNLGSGSVGAKNVGRVLGPTGFIVTLLLDFAKGALAVWLTGYVKHDNGLQALAGVAVVAGHIWPVQLHFKGGKGMATTLGALLVTDYQLAGLFVLLFGCMAAISRRLVLPGLAALACLPLMGICLRGGENWFQLLGLALMVGLVLIAHRKNLLEETQSLMVRPAFDPKQHPPKI